MCYSIRMGKSYSTDLRERVLQAIEEGMSKAQAHRTFHISRSTIDHWFALREHTGGLTPPPHRSRRTRQLEGKEFEAFAQRNRHATLGEMARAWQQEKGVLLSLMSFSRALGEIGWTRKKRVGATRSATKPSEHFGSRHSKRQRFATAFMSMKPAVMTVCSASMVGACVANPVLTGAWVMPVSGFRSWRRGSPRAAWSLL